jgi:hypothetical protein
MNSLPSTILNASHEEGAASLLVSFDRLSAAAKNAGDLLMQSGLAGFRGDTADELRTALAVHDHLLRQYDVKIRTGASPRADVCTVTAHTSQGAYAAVAERQGDEPFGISVMPAAHVDLEAAHRALKISGSLNDALKDKSLSIAIKSYARNKQRRATPATDFKSLAANDRD